MTGVGPKIAIGLAKGGYGEQLARAIQTRSGRDLDTFLHAYREDIRHQMRTNEKGLFERKAGAVASKIPDTWPDVKTAKRYYTPATSEVPQYASFRRQHTWNRMISIPALTQICDEMFEFTHPEILQKCVTCILYLFLTDNASVLQAAQCLGMCDSSAPYQKSAHASLYRSISRRQ